MVWHSRMAPWSIGVGMRIRLLRRGITVPTHRAHIARRRRRANMLVRTVRAREAITSALRQTAASVHEHAHAQEHKSYADGRDDYDRDLFFHKRAFDIFRRGRHRRSVGGINRGMFAGLVESDAEKVGVGGGGVRRG